jgi:arylsulfatase A-like enzyme
MVHWPGLRRGRRIGALVQHLDLFPTLLRALDLEPPAGDAIDLRRLAESDRGRPAVFAHYANDLGEMVRTTRFKYYRQRKPTWVDPGDYFYDLQRDPSELHNLADSGHPELEALAALLDRWRQSSGTPPALAPLDLSDRDRRQLEALGYLQ